MTMRTRSLAPRFAGFAIAALALVTPFSAQKAHSSENAEGLKLDFDQRFEFVECPHGSPSQWFCISVMGEAHSGYLGNVRLARTVVIDFNSNDPDAPVPASTTGTLTTQDGSTLRFRATGAFAPAEEIAIYQYTLQGGTGHFAQAKGTGTITVSSPKISTDTGGTGREHWIGTLAR